MTGPILSEMPGTRSHHQELTGGGRDISPEDKMLRKTMIALFAVASIGMLAPGVAFARGGGGGGGGGGHGGGGGGHSGGFGGGRGFSGGGFGASAVRGG